jgi:hypothetical protein
LLGVLFLAASTQKQQARQAEHCEHCYPCLFNHYVALLLEDFEIPCETLAQNTTLDSHRI